MPFPPSPLFAAFLAASIILAVTPGPGVLFIVSRTLAEGRRAGLASVLGIAMGNLGNALLAALGLALVLKVFPVAWYVLKYLGAAYLAFLGIRALVLARAPVSPRLPGHTGRIFREAFIVALTNPKTTLFYAAFLPTFTRPPGHLVQSLALGALFVGMALVSDTCYALAAGRLASGIARRPRARMLAALLNGTVFLAMAVLTAATPPPPTPYPSTGPSPLRTPAPAPVTTPSQDVSEVRGRSGHWPITRSAIASSCSRVAPPAAWTDMPQMTVTT